MHLRVYVYDYDDFNEREHPVMSLDTDTFRILFDWRMRERGLFERYIYGRDVTPCFMLDSTLTSRGQRLEEGGKQATMA